MSRIRIRNLETGDPGPISAAFAAIGWCKPAAQYERYLSEQAAGSRVVLVATVAGEFAGYVTLRWQPAYRNFRDHGIPEVQDLNVLPGFRRRRIATALMDEAERIVAARCAETGIGVGLHPRYGGAQRMYVLRGYVPDGHGLTYDHEYVHEGAPVTVDDRLVLFFIKSLRASPGTASPAPPSTSGRRSPRG